MYLGAHLLIRVLRPFLRHEDEVGAGRPLGGLRLGGVRVRLGLGSHRKSGYLHTMGAVDSGITHKPL